MARPTTLTPWATTLAAYPGSGQNNRVQPNAALQTGGYPENYEPAPNHFNYMEWESYMWQKYLRDATVRGASYVVRASSGYVGGSAGEGEYDALCDGTDDHVEIQAAIDAVDAQGGGLVLLSEGVFIIDDTIDLKQNVSLMGSGPGTIIRVDPATSSDFDMLAAATTEDNGVISLLALDGNSSNHTQDHTGIHIVAANGWHISDVWVRNISANAGETFGFGFRISGAGERNIISGCSAYNVDLTGILITTAEMNQVTSNQVRACGGAGSGTFRGGIITTSDMNVISGNVVQDCTILGIGVGVSGGGGSPENNIASGNLVQNTSGGPGMYVSGDYSMIQGNSLYNNAHEGIEAEGADYSVITGNIVNFCGVDGITLLDCDWLSCVGNTVIDAGQDATATHAGIYMNGGGTGEFIYGNKFRSTGATVTKYSIEDGGVGSNPVVSGNDCRANSSVAAEILDGSGTMQTVPEFIPASAQVAGAPGTQATVTISQDAPGLANRIN